VVPSVKADGQPTLHWLDGHAVFENPNLRWHLRGTEAEALLANLKTANESYIDACKRLWEDLRTAIEEACNEEAAARGVRIPHIRVLVYKQASRVPSAEAFIAHDLVTMVYHYMLGGVTKEQLDLNAWQTAGDGSGTIKSGATTVGFGAETLELVGAGVAKLIAEHTSPYQRGARELDRMRRDLQYLAGIANEAIGRLSDQDIRCGICPECPYPETVQAASGKGSGGGLTGNGPRKAGRQLGAGNK
jgi:hypothetical protein